MCPVSSPYARVCLWKYNQGSLDEHEHYIINMEITRITSKQDEKFLSAINLKMDYIDSIISVILRDLAYLIKRSS